MNLGTENASLLRKITDRVRIQQVFLSVKLSLMKAILRVICSK